ncbi:MAG: C_GCAxxG_C_C family protein [Oscillospiraceae bacterium]|nr:C_GCAxxG_C_C family protein [Oscillospiraceae bacterium]
MGRAEQAIAYKHAGYNCCQAVLAAYADALGMPPEEAARLGASFGAGMGTMKGTCGALVGAELVLALTQRGSARRLFEAFERACGATICRDLKGIGTGRVLCPCDDCVANAVRALEQP